MYKKKLLTLMVVSLLPFSAVLSAEEEVNVTPEETATEAAVAVEETVAVAAEESKPQSSAKTSPRDAGDDAMAQRWKARDEQYQALRQRAEEAGVMLPERPPWRSAQMETFRPSMEERMAHRQKMMSMSPEERDAYRQERYQEMRGRAQEMGVEMPEMPPWQARRQAMEDEWAKHQEVIKGMTDEERAACHAMHRRHMGMGRHGRGMGCGGSGGCMGPQGYQGGMPPRMNPGYGYGPGPYGQGNFWNPDQ